MFRNFLRILSLVLIVSLLWNMLPVSVLGEELRAAQIKDDTPAVLNPSSTEEIRQLEEITIIGELTDRRTENVKEYLLSNGNTLAAVYGSPVHYREAGLWKEIDNTLTVKADGTYANTAGVWNVSFPQTLSGASSIAITKDEYTLSFEIAGQIRQSNAVVRAGENTLYATEAGNAPILTVSAANISQAQIQQVDHTQAKAAAKHPQLVQEKIASRLSYSQVYANTDIIYDLDSNRVKESIVLSQYDGALSGYRYILNTGGMIPVLGEDGHIDFYDAQGKDIVMTMPAPFLIDASFEYNWDVGVTLTGSGSTYTLTYTLPRQWLAAENRAWPVVLDPVVEASSVREDIADQTVFTGESKSYNWGMVQCGYSTTTGISRFFLAFNALPTLGSADVIVDAQVTLHKAVDSSNTIFVGVHSVNSTWSSSGITWANKPGFSANVSDFSIVKNAGAYTWDVTDIARGWYETGVNTGMMFKSTSAIENQSASSRYAQFYSSDYGTNEPTLILEYRNTSGLEGYWDYTSASAGRAGTAYINTFSGNLVFVRNLMGFDGNRMPVSIDLVYNSSDKDSLGSGTSCTADYGVGNGWRTNYHQRVYQPTGTAYYIWEDADGTKHYFNYNSADGFYYDEDNLNLKLTVSGSTKTITDLAGNTSTFDANGRLTKLQNNQATKSSIDIVYAAATGNMISTITDGVGRIYAFTYTNGVVTKVAYLPTGTSEAYNLSLSYTSGRLTDITNLDGNSCSYTYTSNLLQTASDPHGVGLTFTYQSASPKRIVKVTEHDGNTLGNYIAFEYGNMRTEISDRQGNKKYMLFNAYGNTVSVLNDVGEASFAEYATDKSKAAEKNQLTWSSGLQGTVVDLFANGNFERDTWYTVDGEAEVDYDYNGYLGTYTLHIEYLQDSPSAVNFGQYTVPAGATYTLSAYLKMDSGEIYLRFVNGSTVYASSTSLTGNNSSQWKRLTVSYTNTTQSAVTVTPQVYMENGAYIYIDGVQLEKSASVGRLNLLENGDFAVAASNTDLYMWTHSSLSSDDGRYTMTASAAPGMDSNAMRITGDPAVQKRVTQRIEISGNAGDVFTVAGWGKGYTPQAAATYDGQRQFGIKLTFYTGSGKVGDEITYLFNPHTEDWQYAVGQAVAPGAFTYVILTLLLDYNVGTVYFDGIQLFAEGAGNSYTYNDNGDVETVTNSEGQTTQYGYTGRDLTQVINYDGSTAFYTYDAYKNVTAETVTYPPDSSTGNSVSYITQYTYDTYGNVCQRVKKVQTGSTDPVPISTGAATYTANGNYPLTVTDENGNTTTYTYDQNTGVLRSIENPEGNSSWYSYDSLFRPLVSILNVTGGAISAQNSYSGDRLARVNTMSTSYHFSYGAFGSPQSVSAGEYLLASYEYSTYQNLSALIYGNGAEIEYSYDAKGRVTEERYINGTETKTVSYAYDEYGKLIRTDDGLSGRITIYTYDAQSRLLKTEVWEGSAFLHAVGYVYDSQGRLTKTLDYTSRIGSTPVTYSYDNQQRIWSVSYNWAHQTITYNDAGQPTQIVADHNADDMVSYQYTYNSLSEISGHTISHDGKDVYYTYAYDSLGNITEISVCSTIYGITSTKYITYFYDEAGQLRRENNQPAGYSWFMTYDDAGNMLTRTKHAYTTGDLGPALETQTLTYSSSTWGDRLTGINGTAVTSDAVGNILSDGSGTYTWKNGRQLATATKNGTTWTYTYDASGMRTKRTNGSTTYSYFYDGNSLRKMKIGSDTLTFIYGVNGHPMAVKYNYEYYYYVTNILGDVLAIVDDYGTEVVTYTYDAWGNHLSTGGSMASTLGAYNPLRYRSYVYDQETGLYYLQSRYYNPTICRFISADSIGFLGADGTPLSYNLFAYCANDPVNRYDPTGHLLDTILDIASIIWSVYDFMQYPSWESFGWLAIDVGFAVVPFLTGSSVMKAASKLDDVSDIGGYMNRFDDVYDSIVIGNDMGRVTSLALDTGSMIYDGYKPLNALYALGKADEITDAMRYAAKVDNARFIVDKFNAGYKIINAGSDGRGFIKMMNSAYGMELKILYRLKYGNSLHQLWWILNSGRRIIW